MIMTNTLTVLNHFSSNLCVQCIQSKQEDINQWLLGYERIPTPIYTSVDIRDAGFKIAVVDTNLFPAGFNNLCEHGVTDAVALMKSAIIKRVPHARRIIIAAEDHTRNTWYLENIRILQSIIAQSGFDVTIAAFFQNTTSFCEQNAHAIELETATGHTVKIHCFKNLLNKIETKSTSYDLILMNNDLTGGIPDELLKTGIPTFPSMHAGWHARHKSAHFHHTNQLIDEFAKIVGIDPWQFSCLFEVVDQVDMDSNEGLQSLYSAATLLYERIALKYKEHNIDDKPFIFIKSDSGTYGLGVIPIEDPKDILSLNKRKRGDLIRGKGGSQTRRFLIQEGVPTIHRIADNPCEVCVYQIDNNFVGGFYRSHSGKNTRQNLNAPGGMNFQKMCPHLDKYGKDCGIKHDLNIFDIYRILGRIAGIAASREIKELEAKL